MNLSNSEFLELCDLLDIAENLSGEMITNVMIMNVVDYKIVGGSNEGWLCNRIVHLRWKNDPDRVVRLKVGYGLKTSPFTLPGLV